MSVHKHKEHENIRMIQVVPGIQGRFIRISFIGEKAAITDVQVMGTGSVDTGCLE